MANITDISAKALSINQIGVNHVHIPFADNRIRLAYIALSADGANTADVTVTIKFGADSPLYKFSLKPGCILARNIGAGRHRIQGQIGEALVATLSAAQTVHVSIEFEEV